MFPGYELADQRESILPGCFKQPPYMVTDVGEFAPLFFEQRLEFILPEGTLYDQPWHDFSAFRQRAALSR